jgi:hypothetical protein
MRPHWHGIQTLPIVKLAYAKDIDFAKISRLNTDEVASHFNKTDNKGRFYYTKPLSRHIWPGTGSPRGKAAVAADPAYQALQEARRETAEGLVDHGRFGSP